MPPAPLRRDFADAAEFLSAFDGEIARGGLFLPGASPPEGATTALAPVEVLLVAPGLDPVTLPARVASVVPGHGTAVLFDGVPEALARAAERLRGAPTGSAASPPVAGPTPTAAERIRRLSVPEKVALALAGDREERFALLRDPNKTVHLYVLKNPRIGLDEVQYAAKNPALSPDALKHMADHREWGADQAVRLALVRNARTPTSVALRLLPLLPEREIRVFAKGNGRPEIVQAARRLVT